MLHPRTLLKRWVRALSYQKKTPLTMPPTQRLEMLRRGFRSSAYELYDFANNDPTDYLPDTKFGQASRINGPFCRSILDDKLLFSAFFGAHVRVPRVLALIERGTLHALHPEPAVGSVTTLLEYCRAHSGVVLKPVAGWQGEGISSVRVVGGELLLNDAPLGAAELGVRLAALDSYLVGELIRQDGPAHAIFPHAANSIRITTMQDPDDAHRPFIPVAVHRFGSSTTTPTDNVSRGGLFAQIDLETGVMGPALKFPHETGGRRYWCSVHPDTGAPIEGVRVPEWDAVKAQVLDLCERFGFLRYVGWDIVVAQGSSWFLEANHNPTLAVQLFCPYLKEPRTRRFFEHHGVI